MRTPALARKSLAALALLATVVLGSRAADAAPPTQGQKPPTFTLAAHDGSTVELAKSAGRPLVLVFYRGYW